MHEKTCPCGVKFAASHGSQKWCTPKCKRRAAAELRYARKKAAGLCVYPGCHDPARPGRTLCAACARQHGNRVARRAALKPRSPGMDATCAVCGDAFSGRAGRKYCSPACRDRRRRVAVRRPSPEEREASRMRERKRRQVRGATYGSAWQKLRALVLSEESTCHLCGHEIDMDLEYPHPDSATVDHVLPLSKGGAALDRGNTRAAHLWCNLSKGAKRKAG